MCGAAVDSTICAAQDLDTSVSLGIISLSQFPESGRIRRINSPVQSIRWSWEWLQSPESQQSAGPTRLHCPLHTGAHCVLLLAPHPLQPTSRRNHLQDQYRARRVSTTPPRWLLGCPRVSSPREEMPGEDSAFPMVSFQLEHTDSKVWEGKLWPSTAQTNCNFQVQKLVSYPWYISCQEEDDSLPQVIPRMYLHFLLASPLVHSLAIAYL